MKVKVKGTIDNFIRALDPERREIVVALRTIIHKAIPKAEESIKWGSPWWTQNGYVCCIYTAGDHINFGFSRGVELTDPDGLLEGTGKGMRHVKLNSVKDIRKTQFTAWLKEAAKLNEADTE
jgi:hypothetical protein